MVTSRPNIQMEHRLPRGGNVCDFCGSPDVTRLYACKNFDYKAVPIFRGSTGRWAGCAVCVDLISRSRWMQLIDRVMAEVDKRKGLRATELLTLRNELKALHAGFVSHRLKGSEIRILDTGLVAVGQ